MKLIRFTGEGDGVVDDPAIMHMDGVGPDYTLCGLTLDGDTKTAGAYEIVKAHAVTCPSCIAIIKHCRGAKINPRPCGD